MDGNDFLIAQRGNVGQGILDRAPIGEGGLRQFTGGLACIDIGGKDVHAVGKFPVPAADLQGKDKDRGSCPLLRAQIGAGVGKQGDLLRIAVETDVVH